MHKKNAGRNLAASINVRLQPPDMLNLRSICARLDLEQSEVARRAIKEGLKSFRNVRLPGASSTVEQTLV